MTDRLAWVRTHRVCWEIEPLRELTKGHGLQQTGYELKLVGRLELGAGDPPGQALYRLHDGLRELALDVLASHPEPHAVIAVRPFEHAVHLRPGSGSAAEIELTVVAYPRHRDDPLPQAEAQRRIAAIGRTLRAMGIQRCSGAASGALEPSRAGAP
jgi:hypothetical protein